MRDETHCCTSKVISDGEEAPVCPIRLQSATALGSARRFDILPHVRRHAEQPIPSRNLASAA